MEISDAQAAKENDVDKKPRGPSKLKPEVEKLIQLICNINMMKQQMMEIGKEFPVWKFSSNITEPFAKSFIVYFWCASIHIEAPVSH